MLLPCASMRTPCPVPMDYFTRAVESVLTSAPQWDCLGLQLTEGHWERAVRESGYVAAQQTVSQVA